MSNTRVYVGGLSYRARERDLEKFFRKYGRIREISMKNGYAFVEFEDGRDADDAVYELNGKDLMGDRVTVEIARGTPHGRDRDRWGSGGGGGGGRRSRSRSPRGGSRERPVWLEKYGPPTRTDHKLIVENLSSRVSWQDLKDYMRQAGEVTYADAHKNKRNEGVVEFGSYEDLKTALDKLDGTELNGRKIKLVDCTRGDSGRSSSSRRRRSRSRTRSRSGDRKRSRRSRSKERNDRSKTPDSPAATTNGGGKGKTDGDGEDGGRGGSGRGRGGDRSDEDD